MVTATPPSSGTARRPHRRSTTRSRQRRGHRAGSFGTGVDISAAASSAGDPAVAIGPDGTANAAWYRYDGSSYVVEASSQPRGGSFIQPAQADLCSSGYAYRPDVAFLSDRTAIAVWYRYLGVDCCYIQSATRPPGSTFGAVTDAPRSGRRRTTRIWPSTEQAMRSRLVALARLRAVLQGLATAVRGLRREPARAQRTGRAVDRDNRPTGGLRRERVRSLVGALSHLGLR